jgi:hypothetical protein
MVFDLVRGFPTRPVLRPLRHVETASTAGSPVCIADRSQRFPRLYSCPLRSGLGRS